MLPRVQPTPTGPPSPVIPLHAHSEEQELRAKLRVMEARRADDVQRIRELETRLADAENFVALRPKLQAKLNNLQKDLLQTRRDLQDSKAELQLSESKQSEAAEQLEMAMLDKEVADEKAEAAEAELEAIKERLAIAEVELGVLKEGQEGGGGAQDETSLAYIQLKKHNERLKEALLR